MKHQQKNDISRIWEYFALLHFTVPLALAHLSYLLPACISGCSYIVLHFLFSVFSIFVHIKVHHNSGSIFFRKYHLGLPDWKLIMNSINWLWINWTTFFIKCIEVYHKQLAQSAENLCTHLIQSALKIFKSHPTKSGWKIQSNLARKDWKLMQLHLEQSGWRIYLKVKITLITPCAKWLKKTDLITPGINYLNINLMTPCTKWLNKLI